MTVPLVVLAVFAVGLGFVGTPLWPWLQTYLTGHHEATSALSVVLLMVVSAVAVFAGIGLGGILYGLMSPERSDELDPLEEMQPSIFEVLRNKFYVDELYDLTVVRLNRDFGRLCRWLDDAIVSTMVAVVSYVTLGVSWIVRICDEYLVNLGFDQTCRKVRQGGNLFSRVQDGRVQHYLRVIGVAAIIFLLLLTWGWAK
jgi:NADH-quinone oxidoreductase subunit L